MPALMDLPDELRLRIYQFAVTERWPIHFIQQSFCFNTAENIQRVDKRLQHDIVPLFWSSNVFNIYLAVDNASPHNGVTYLQWLELVLQDAAKHVRKLDFIVAARCERRKQALENPKEPGIWYRADAPNCTTTISVDLSQVGDRAISVDEEEGCLHKAEITSRFSEVLSRIPRSNRRPQVTKAILWDLFESCSVLSSRYSGYWPYEQALKMYAPGARNEATSQAASLRYPSSTIAG